MRLVTWNTQWCRGIDGVVSPGRIVEVANLLADFDLLCLQEISINYPALAGNPGHDQPVLLAELLPGYQLFFGAAVDELGEDGQRRQFGNLIASRLPVAQVQHHVLPYPADAGVPSMPRMATVVTVRDPQLGAVRVMTSHLEFYSQPQRLAQAQALRDLQAQACGHVAAPPRAYADGSPFQRKEHTPHAIVCGDFNFEAHQPEYAEISRPFEGGQLVDSWRHLHGEAPHPPTFRLYDRSHGPDPVACDFVFVSDTLSDRLRRIDIDGATQASDHQPVAIELG